MTVLVRPAAVGEHSCIMRVAHQTKWTRDFGNQVMFSSAATYARGWVHVAIGEDGEVAGFSCVRVMKRRPEVTLYFLGVDATRRHTGVGGALLDAVRRLDPQRSVVLKCAVDNEVARRFYLHRGFGVTGEVPGYWLMAAPPPTH